MPPYCDSETGRLLRVGLVAPSQYWQPDPINRRQEREALGEPVSRDRLVEEHEGLRRTFWDAGVETVDVEPTAELPFLLNVRDAAVVVGDALVACRMAKQIRAAEPAWVAAGLGIPCVDPFSGVEGPETIEGGDVFQLGDELVIGLSDRTSEAGARRFAEWVNRPARLVALQPGILHFDTVFNVVGDVAFVLRDGLVNPQGLNATVRDLGVKDVVDVTQLEAAQFATNFLCLAPDHVLIAGECESAISRLAGLGVRTTAVEMSEHHRIGGSVRCATLALDRDPFVGTGR